MLFGSAAITAYILVVAALLGMVVGSFVNCWAWRSLRGESVMHGRSHCATCNHELAVRDLIPLVSWLASRGRCRYCGQKISARYPLSELACALAYVGIVARYGLSLETVELLVFAAILLFLSLTDLDDYLIPNGCIVAAIVVRVLYMVGAWALEGADIAAMLVQSAIGGVVLGGALLLVTLVGDKVLGRPTMGGGDIKLFFVAGLYFGWQQGLFLVIVACVVGIILAVVVPHPREEEHDGASAEGSAVTGATDESADNFEESPNAMKRMIPFGPSIAIACVITMLAGQPFIDWYLSLLGL